MSSASPDERLEFIRRQSARHAMEVAVLRRRMLEKHGPPPPWKPAREPDKGPTRAPRLIDKAMSFIRAVSGPRATDAEYELRMATCRQCRYRKEHAGELYCGACGCPRWHLAKLSVKLRLADIECPDSRF